MMAGLLGAQPGLLVARLTVGAPGRDRVQELFRHPQPSRDGDGGHIATGLGIGVDGTHRRTKAITAMGAAMTAGLAVGAPRTAMARANAGPHWQIEIHQQPGENAEALAWRVAEMIRAMGGGGPGGFNDPF
jgi:hypothetical protein